MVLAPSTVKIVIAFTNLGNKEEVKVQVEKEVLVLTWPDCPRQGCPLSDDTEGSEHKGTGLMGR